MAIWPSSPPGVQREQPTETLVAVEGHRWAIEDSFETAKNEFGLDHNESRSWHGWHRHVSPGDARLRHDLGAMIRA
jgi:hypothetical protein